MPAADLLLERLPGPLAEEGQLELARSPLEAEEQAVVHLPGVVHPAVVDEQGGGRWATTSSK